MKNQNKYLITVLVVITLFSCEKAINPEFTSSWDKYSGNPILSKSNEILGERVDWDYFCAADCSVLKDGDTYNSTLSTNHQYSQKSEREKMGRHVNKGMTL